MNLSKIEKKVLEQLAANGAATVQELTEAIACSLSGVQNAMRTLRAADLIRPHDLKHVPGFYKRIRTYVTNTTPPPTAGNSSLLVRVAALEDAVEKLTQIQNELNVNGIKAGIKIIAKRVEDLDLDCIRIDGVLMEQGDRLRALENPQPAVDPLYLEIEKDITDKLGDHVSPELLCIIINEAYAERTK